MERLHHRSQICLLKVVLDFPQKAAGFRLLERMKLIIAAAIGPVLHSGSETFREVFDIRVYGFDLFHPAENHRTVEIADNRVAQKDFFCAFLDARSHPGQHSAHYAHHHQVERKPEAGVVDCLRRDAQQPGCPVDEYQRESYHHAPEGVGKHPPQTRGQHAAKAAGDIKNGFLERTGGIGKELGLVDHRNSPVCGVIHPIMSTSTGYFVSLIIGKMAVDAAIMHEARDCTASQPRGWRSK